MRHRRTAGRGFTLIELLVVLVIVAVLAAVVSLSVGGSGARELQNAAERTRSLISLACERASIGGRDIGFVPLEGGMRFGYYGIDGWRAIEPGGIDELRARPWGEGVEVVAERDGEPMPISDSPPEAPPFACLSSGELTPLRLRFSRAGVADVWQLEGNFDGSLSLSATVDAH